MPQPIRQAFDPFGAHSQDPYPFFAWARREEPVFYMPEMGLWGVTRWEDVHHILRSPDLFSSANSIRPVIPTAPAALAELAAGYPTMPMAITTDGDDHKRRRAPLAKAFGAEAATSLEPFIRRRAEELVDAFAGDGRTDLVANYAGRLPLDVVVQVFDLDPADAAEVTGGSKALLELFTAPLAKDRQVEAARKVVTFQRLAARYITDRREKPGDDLISALVAEVAQGDGPMTFAQEAELVAEVTENWFAGHMTTVALMGLGLYSLLAHRDQWELLCTRPELLKGAVDEILRHDSSVPCLFRVATQPVTVAGREYPAGTEFALMFGAANRDERVADESERFDITRQPTRHLTFGYGVHFCAGQPLARKQLEITLETLTRRLPGMRLTPGAAFEIEPLFNLRGLRALHVEWDTPAA